jgi:hypothetical protein
MAMRRCSICSAVAWETGTAMRFVGYASEERHGQGLPGNVKREELPETLSGKRETGNEVESTTFRPPVRLPARPSARPPVCPPVRLTVRPLARLPARPSARPPLTTSHPTPILIV